MGGYTEAELKRAKDIVEGLRTEDGRRELKNLEDGLSVADPQGHAEQFYDDLELLEHVGLDFPALRLGDKSVVPVALSEVIWPRYGFAAPSRSWREFYPSRYLRDQLYEEMRRGEARLGDDVTTLSPPEARKTFVARASEFLASRFAGYRMLAGGSPGAPPPELSMPKFIGGPRTKVVGCLFSVHTKSPGLSAYWSGAYLISSNYHGAPTTPAKGVLQAGVYIFGVNGGAYGSIVQWDRNKVCTLPGTPSVRLAF